jgi:phosphoglycolate phosphatase-like HAD superfamily hydrolase
MLTLPKGELALSRAAASVAGDAYQRIVAAIRAEHDEQYGAVQLLKRTFGERIEVVVFERDTQGPADTVAQMIRRAGVGGAIAIKDADSFFDATPLPASSFVALSDVRRAPEMSNVGGKSFAVVNENGLVVEMVEKSLASNFVSVGLYGFQDASDYLDVFGAVARANESGEIFVSQVMNRAIAGGEVIRPLFVSNFVDVGTLPDWRRYVRARGSVLADLDGVVFQNHSAHFPPFWDEADIAIEENVAVLRSWQDQGAQLIFVTARPEAYRGKTEQALKALGLNPHALVMNCNHGRRFLVNDHAPSNPYPSAVAISIERNSAKLPDYLKDWQ